MTTTTTEDPTYRVTFDRIGRMHNPPDLVTTAGDGDALAEAVFQHARKYVLSRDIDVEIVGDDEFEEAKIYVGGFRPAGTGTITKETPA